ncbi:MAG: DNA repair protein RecO [Anaerolineae bacterium]|nr:DNA repair protein RecO [Anaerolineae bacterium]
MSSRERSFRTPAIILKRFDLGEADRLLTLLTPHHGKIEVVVKGARKLTSTKTGHVELFTRADMLIHRGRDLGIAVQAEMVAPYLPLRDDLTLGAYAAYAAELCDRFALDGDDDTARLFALLDATFERLCGETDPRLALRYYELHLLDLAGFRPELNECVIGHEDVQPEDQFFTYAEGGVVCPRDAARGSSFVPLPMLTLKLLRHMQRSPYAQVKSLQVDTRLHDDLERILQGYILYLLERRLQSADFIRRLRYS